MTDQSAGSCRLIVLIIVLLGYFPGLARSQASQPTSPVECDFARFDSLAQTGHHLNVVFFGASLTWGANASDPQQTSYRAQIAHRLTEKYPEAHFTFWDAAIGGTGSQLGIFRLDRDVLRHHPDLVFLDFSANDDISSRNPETLASYEALVRRIILEAHAPVVQVIFPFRWNVQSGTLDRMPRRDAHHAISHAYHTAIGDAIELALQRVKDGQATIAQLWPIDGVHPGDAGYTLFADAAWDAFLKAVRDKLVCAAPSKMLAADTYIHIARVRLSSLGAPPAGWRVGEPNHVSAYFDMLMSRWLDDETIVGQANPATRPTSQPSGIFRCEFKGRMVMLFGESTPQSGQYRVRIDGNAIACKSGDGKTSTSTFDAGGFARKLGGNGHLAQVLAEGLAPDATHVLEIEPVLTAGQELRFESICVAGPSASVGAAHD